MTFTEVYNKVLIIVLMLPFAYFLASASIFMIKEYRREIREDKLKDEIDILERECEKLKDKCKKLRNELGIK